MMSRDGLSDVPPRAQRPEFDSRRLHQSSNIPIGLLGRGLGTAPGGSGIRAAFRPVPLRTRTLRVEPGIIIRKQRMMNDTGISLPSPPAVRLRSGESLGFIEAPSRRSPLSPPLRTPETTRVAELAVLTQPVSPGLRCRHLPLSRHSWRAGEAFILPRSGPTSSTWTTGVRVVLTTTTAWPTCFSWQRQKPNARHGGRCGRRAPTRSYG